MRNKLVWFVATLLSMALTGCPGGTLGIEKHKETMAALRSIAESLETVREQTGAYPVSRETECSQVDWPESMVVGRMVDAWRQPLWYMSSGKSYVLWSLGDDGIKNASAGGPDHHFETDIVIYNGHFWQWLEGLHKLEWDQTIDPFALVRSEMVREPIETKRQNDSMPEGRQR